MQSISTDWKYACNISSIQAQVTDAEREAFKKTFDVYDKNKDGHITAAELQDVLGKLGQKPTKEEIDEFIKACDIDKNGTIEFNEFCKYLVQQRRKVMAYLYSKWLARWV